MNNKNALHASPFFSISHEYPYFLPLRKEDKGKESNEYM